MPKTNNNNSKTLESLKNTQRVTEKSKIWDKIEKYDIVKIDDAIYTALNDSTSLQVLVYDMRRKLKNTIFYFSVRKLKIISKYS